MSTVSPAFAAVRPRGILAGATESLLLEVLVAEIAEEMSHGVVHIDGPPGSGKSTALAHLAAVFAGDGRLVLLDQPSVAEFEAWRNRAIVVVDLPCPALIEVRRIRLTPWRQDELIEYLLSTHSAKCRSVIVRLGASTRRAWSPQLASIVLRRFCIREGARDPVDELCQYVREQVSDLQLSQAGRYCLAHLPQGEDVLNEPLVQSVRQWCPDDVRTLLRHPEVRLPLAADFVASSLGHGLTTHLVNRMSRDLVDLIGSRCRVNPLAIQCLRDVLATRGLDGVESMAASILCIADPSWRPARKSPWCFAGGCFHGVDWLGVDVTNASLANADLTAARLDGAVLYHADALEGRFDGAQLAGADLRGLRAAGASFCGADLTRARLTNANVVDSEFTDADLNRAELQMAHFTGANLTGACLSSANLYGANLERAILEGADFTGAILNEANLSGVDVRNALLAGASLERAMLAGSQMEFLYLPQARLLGATLRGAHLTGSRLPGADLRDADLTYTGLAEIEWEHADLRRANLTGATFHMGSSRSGLVGSPIACEGSRTGFYTDDYDDKHFKRPEEVRKANLCGADLRGAKIDELDFYLVDLRHARLDAAQLVYVRKCGAILEDAPA